MIKLPIRELVKWLGVLMPLVIALGVPTVHYLVWQANEVEMLDFKVALNARRMERYINIHAEKWEFKGFHLAKQIALPSENGQPIQQTIENAHHAVILVVGKSLPTPIFTKEVPLSLDDKVVGYLSISTSRVPLLIATGRLAIFSFLFGIGAFYFLRILLLRLLDKTLRDLAANEERLKEAQKISCIGNFDLDIVNHKEFWSLEMYRILELTPEETTPNYETFLNFVHPEDRQSLEDGHKYCLETRKPYKIEFRGVRRNGDIRHFNAKTKIAFGSDGAVVRMYGTIQDITVQKKREIELQLTKDKVERLAYLDDLTGLANRVRCQADLTARFSDHRDKNEFSMIHIDIDNFKRVNDSLGHLAGDKVLQEIGGRMKLLAEESGFAKAYRWGGDEFVIISNNCDSATLTEFCEELTDLISVPIRYKETTMWTTGSIGVAKYPEDGSDLHSLMIYSDLAMYKSKDVGRDSFHFFTEEMKVKIDEETRIEKDLRKAIENDELFLVFQPQLDVITKQVTGIEALVRWNHPERGILSPGSFLSVAESSSLAPKVGQIVLHKALSAARKWLDMGYQIGRIGLNISPQYLKEGDFAGDLREEMKQQNIAPESIAVEVLESIFLDDPDSDKIGEFVQLHQEGVHIQLDDFGTGYASLSHLSTLPVNAIKIDKSFIQKMTEDNKKVIVVKSLISLAEMLNIDTICEGIETARQYEMLQEMGQCSIQGYYTCRPKPFRKMTDWLENQPVAPSNIHILEPELKLVSSS